MQFSAVIALAFAAAAAAAPGGWGPSPKPYPYQSPTPSTSTPAPTSSPSPACSNNQTGLCCTGNDTISLNCLLSGAVLGSSCTQQQICCQNFGSGDQTCTNNDGTTISIPITIDPSLNL